MANRNRTLVSGLNCSILPQASEPDYKPARHTKLTRKHSIPLKEFSVLPSKSFAQ
jgi:hypothetical protein